MMACNYFEILVGSWACALDSVDNFVWAGENFASCHVFLQNAEVSSFALFFEFIVFCFHCWGLFVFDCARSWLGVRRFCMILYGYIAWVSWCDRWCICLRMRIFQHTYIYICTYAHLYFYFVALAEQYILYLSTCNFSYGILSFACITSSGSPVTWCGNCIISCGNRVLPSWKDYQGL